MPISRKPGSWTLQLADEYYRTCIDFGGRVSQRLYHLHSDKRFKRQLRLDETNRCQWAFRLARNVFTALPLAGNASSAAQTARKVASAAAHGPAARLKPCGQKGFHVGVSVNFR